MSFEKKSFLSQNQFAAFRDKNLCRGKENVSNSASVRTVRFGKQKSSFNQKEKGSKQTSIFDQNEKGLKCVSKNFPQSKNDFSGRSPVIVARNECHEVGSINVQAEMICKPMNETDGDESDDEEFLKSICKKGTQEEEENAQTTRKKRRKRRSTRHGGKV